MKKKKKKKEISRSIGCVYVSEFLGIRNHCDILSSSNDNLLASFLLLFIIIIVISSFEPLSHASDLTPTN